MKIQIAALFCCIAMLFTPACHRNPREERIKSRTVVLNIAADPRSLDPSLATEQPAFQAILCLTRGLTYLDAQGNPQPDLAESWKISNEGKTYEFKLRPARWSNGQPVTADDFLYAWTRRVLNPKFGCEYAYQMYYHIKGAREFFNDQTLGPESVWVTALAPDRLMVTFNTPAPYIPALLAHNIFYPICRSVDEANPDWAKRPETYVGCGPFIMKSYTSGYELVAEKNPNYWNAANVRMDRIVLRMISEESTERIAFENGELDATYTVPRPDIPSLRKNPEFHIEPIDVSYFLNFNCERPLFKDIRVRRALALAIDRQAIVKNILKADEKPAFTLTPPNFYKEEKPKESFADARFDEARKLLAEAGYPGGRGFPRLHYIFNEMEMHRQIAQVLQETWRRELGIEIQVENQEFKVLIENRHQGNFDIARNAWAADFKDPINFLEIFDSKSDNNDSHWLDPKFDGMLADIRAEDDQERREGISAEAEEYMMSQMPIIPVFFETRPYLSAAQLHYTRNPMDFFNPVTLAWKETSK